MHAKIMTNIILKFISTNQMTLFLQWLLSYDNKTTVQGLTGHKDLVPEFAWQKSMFIAKTNKEE